VRTSAPLAPAISGVPNRRYTVPISATTAQCFGPPAKPEPRPPDARPEKINCYSPAAAARHEPHLLPLLTPKMIK
jgi:hypothetical protein